MIRIALILLLLALVAPAHAGLVFGPDAFTVTSDTNIDAYPAGAVAYTYSLGTTTDVLVNATNDWIVLRDNSLATGSYAIVTTPNLSAMTDQEARAVILSNGSGGSGAGGGVILRDDGSGDSYAGLLDFTQSLGNSILEFVAGSPGLLVNASRGLAVDTDYSFALRAVGTSLSLIINGETAVTGTSSTRTSGSPGVWGYDTIAAGNPGKLDDFEVDDLSTGVYFVGQGAQLASTGTSFVPVIPTTTANDLGVLVLVGRPTDTSLVATITGSTWTEITECRQLIEVGANDLRLQVWYRRMTGGDTNPTVTIPTNWQGVAAGISGQIATFRGVDTTTALDATSVGSQTAAAATFTPTGITTGTANAMVIGIVGTADDNALRMSTMQNFTAWMGGATYNTTTGGDHAVGMGSRQVVAAAAVTMPTWTETAALSPADAWVGCAIALKKQAAAGSSRRYSAIIMQ